MRNNRPPPASASCTPEPPPLADVVERLCAVFAARLTRTDIVAVIQRCRDDLDTVPDPALPELVERLARHRLHNLAAGASTVSDETEWDGYRRRCSRGT